MRQRNISGPVITFVFTLAGFVIALYELLSPNSLFTGTLLAWCLTGFMFLTVIFSACLFKARQSVLAWLTMLCLVIVGVLSIVYGLHYLLACVVIALIGAIIYLA